MPRKLILLFLACALPCAAKPRPHRWPAYTGHEITDFFALAAQHTQGNFHFDVSGNLLVNGDTSSATAQRQGSFNFDSSGNLKISCTGCSSGGNAPRLDQVLDPTADKTFDMSATPGGIFALSNALNTNVLLSANDGGGAVLRLTANSPSIHLTTPNDTGQGYQTEIQFAHQASDDWEIATNSDGLANYEFVIQELPTGLNKLFIKKGSTGDMYLNPVGGKVGIGVNPTGSPAAELEVNGDVVFSTQTAGDNSTKGATTAFVTTAVNNAIAAVNPAVAVQAATNAILPNSPTYNNGASGIGAFITTLTLNTALVVDGYTPILNDRILVKNEASGGGLGAAKNGVYTVTQVSGVGLAWILTRALDYDMPSDINNTGAIPVVNGTANTTTQWVITSTVVTVGTDALTFTKFASNPANQVLAVSPGAGIAHFAGSTQTVTSSAVTSADATGNTSGSGNFCLVTSCTMITPTLGAATATSVNKMAITAPATSSTLAVADGKTLTASNTLTFTGTDSSSVAFGAGGTVTYTIASGAKALATGAISSATCTSAQTATATGTLTTDRIVANFNGDPTAVTGYIPSTSGMLTIIFYPTADTVNFKVCNNTSSSITPGAVTINWEVVR